MEGRTRGVASQPVGDTSATSSSSSSSITSQPPPQPACVLTFSLHAVVLSSASGYFKTLFTTSMGGWCPDCKVATQILEGRELKAAEHVLEYIYTNELPADGGLAANRVLLLWMIKVADRWDVPACIKACQASLLALSNFKFPISTVFSLSSTFCPSLAISELLAEAGIRLLNLFGDAPSVMRHPAKLKKLKRLPQSAMLALLLSDKLTTDAEATVLQLLLAWYTCNKSSCDEDELEELKAGVRYSRLTPAYLCGMLPLLPEPEFAVTIEEANHLRLDASFRTEFEAEERQRLNGPCPKGWFLAERPFLGSSLADNFIKVRLKIPQNELLLHAAAVSKMRGGGSAPEGILSPRGYGCGYDWRISLVSRDVDRALAWLQIK
ncbi:MAG: hypothetical protein WDW38_011509 [Sanguina aurantia]